MLLCIDIGNTNTHYGLVTEADGARAQYDIPTRSLEDPAGGIGPKIAAHLARQPGIEGLAFCSVVPSATEALRRTLARDRFPLPVLHLTHDKKLGIPITYPRPAEIGQDRLAGAAGALSLGDLPAIVIDMGTAVTLDIVTRARGYEGGIIAPGLELMRRYLHEQTAQLPALDESITITRAIGQSTIEAMRIGTVIGFGGMIQALLAAVLADLAKRGEPPPRILSTGGSAALLRDRLKIPFDVVPDLTLRGLAAAWNLNHKQRTE